MMRKKMADNRSSGDVKAAFRVFDQNGDGWALENLYFFHLKEKKKNNLIIFTIGAYYISDGILSFDSGLFPVLSSGQWC